MPVLEMPTRLGSLGEPGLNIRETREFLRGRAGEQIVAPWLMERGWFVIPSYDYAGEGGDKPPRLQGLPASHPVPDLDISRDGKRRWVEVKTKTDSVEWRITGELRHGIEYRLFKHYVTVERITGSECWLAILEESTGDLLGQTFTELGQPYTGTALGKRMAYWGRRKFLFLANFPDLSTRIDAMCARRDGGEAA